jgi:hypothetical protein
MVCRERIALLRTCVIAARIALCLIKTCGWTGRPSVGSISWSEGLWSTSDSSLGRYVRRIGISRAGLEVHDESCSCEMMKVVENYGTSRPPPTNQMPTCSTTWSSLPTRDSSRLHPFLLTCVSPILYFFVPPPIKRQNDTHRTTNQDYFRTSAP